MESRIQTLPLQVGLNFCQSLYSRLRNQQHTEDVIEDEVYHQTMPWSHRIGDQIWSYDYKSALVA